MLKSLSGFLLAACLLMASLAALAGEAYWIDVRSAQEYQAGHVEGAVNIPHTEILDRIGEVTNDKDGQIYLYCRSGGRAGVAQKALNEAGYPNVVNLGGLEQARAKAEELPSH